jgi:hypothetical protein
MNPKHVAYIICTTMALTNLEKHAAPVQGFVPKNDIEHNENCYAYLTGDPQVIFQAMTTNAKPFRINTNDIVPQVFGSSRADAALQSAREYGPEKYYAPSKRVGARPSLSHTQSIKMVRRPHGARPEFIFIAAGDSRSWKSHLFIAQHPSHAPLTDQWKIIRNIVLNDDPDENDLWHPGGMDISGNYLAIPVEDFVIKDYLSKELYPGVLKHYEPRSKIMFFDISDPMYPKRLPVAIERNSGWCPAVAFTRLHDGHYLIYIAGAGDVYISKTTKITDGFNHTGTIDGIPGQNASFITIGPAGDLYIVATENNNKATPVIAGDNIARLFKFNFDAQTKTGSLPYISERICDCGGGGIFGLGSNFGCNFNAAATVTPMGGLLGIYHYIIDGKYLGCTLFGPDIENAAQRVEELIDILGDLKV